MVKNGNWQKQNTNVHTHNTGFRPGAWTLEDESAKKKKKIQSKSRIYLVESRHAPTQYKQVKFLAAIL